MTVAELIARLSECDPNAQVRIVEQPGWPQEHEVGGIALGTDFVVPGDWDDVAADESAAASAVYITEGAHIGYGRVDAFASAS